MKKGQKKVATVTVRFDGFTPDGRIAIKTDVLYRDAEWYKQSKNTWATKANEWIATAMAEVAKIEGVDRKSIRMTFHINEPITE